MYLIGVENTVIAKWMRSEISSTRSVNFPQRNWPVGQITGICKSAAKSISPDKKKSTILISPNASVALLLWSPLVSVHQFSVITCCHVIILQGWRPHVQRLVEGWKVLPQEHHGKSIVEVFFKLISHNQQFSAGEAATKSTRFSENIPADCRRITEWTYSHCAESVHLRTGVINVHRSGDVGREAHTITYRRMTPAEIRDNLYLGCLAFKMAVFMASNTPFIPKNPVRTRAF